jgi:alpha-acetolactate decarboxylase
MTILKDYRRGTVVGTWFPLYAHLVFVTKYQRAFVVSPTSPRHAGGYAQHYRVVHRAAKGNRY